MRRYAFLIVSLGFLVGFAHYFAQYVAVSSVTNCHYFNESCSLAKILVPVVGFPAFSLGLGGPDLDRQMILNSIIWALGASALALAVARKLVSRH
jgi:hypothetical protein